MRTLLVLCLLVTLFSLPMLADADEAAGSFANEPIYSLDVRYDDTSRTIEGSFDLRFVPETATAYFSLLANLDAEPNPYLAPRQQDAVYPFGFELSRISILSVEQVTDSGAQALPFRLLAMPPSDS